MFNNICKIIFSLAIISFVNINLHAKVRFGISGNYVEVNNTNEHYLAYVRYMTVPENKQKGAVWNKGNDITGKSPEEIKSIVDAIKALETDPIRREIYDKMNSITLEWFTFMTTEEAKKEVKLRLEAIAKIKHMNSDQFYWYDDAMPYETDTANWEPAYANSYFWVQKSGTAYAAITELCDGSKKTQGECYGAIIACVWWGSSRALATTDFNTKYQGVKALHMHKFYKDVAYRDKQIRVAIDTTVHIPGDWLYMKNYNYGKVIKEKGFWKKEWLNQNIRYPWQGENAIYVGKGKYEGLGLVNMTEAEMREEMRINYNRNFKKVIKNGGKVDGVPIQTIRKGADADSKIIWTSQNRLHN